MARTDGKKEVQHYVPKFLLQKFCTLSNGGGDQIHVYDKHTGKAFLANVTKVAAEKSFYDFKLGEKALTFEHSLTKIENKCKPLLERLLDARRLDVLSPGERAWIGGFAAMQLLRTKSQRDLIVGLDKLIRKKIEEMGANPHSVEGYKPLESEAQIKTQSILFAIKAAKEFTYALLEKEWILLETTPSAPFWIGDHPVVMHNENNFGPMGNLGLRVKGIQVYLPISKTMSLGMFCPSIGEKMREELAEAKKQRGAMHVQRVIGAYPNMPLLDAAIKAHDAVSVRLERFVNALDKGEPAASSAENVTFQNSMQVGYAARFVMSPTSNFTLAAKMMRENPQLKTGKKFEELGAQDDNQN